MTGWPVAIPNLKLTEKITDRLGEAGIREVAAHLWARDCQTCGEPLGDQPPALYVIDMHSHAFAELNHQSCRAPDWNDSGIVTGMSSQNAYLSHEALSVVLPFSKSGALDLRPALLVNPGLEAVSLKRDGHDQWQVEVESRFEQAGLRPMGQIVIDGPVKGATATLRPFEIEVAFTDPPFSTYGAPIEGSTGPDIRVAHESTQGVLVLVSHLFDFTRPTPDHISEVFSSGRVRGGWVGFTANGR